MDATESDGLRTAAIGVAVAVERLLRAGYYVAVPIVDVGYDLVVMWGRRTWRVQVKATYGGGSKSNRRRIRIGRGRSKRQHYCPKQVDAFVLVNLKTGQCMCIPVSEVVGKRWVCWSDSHKWGDIGIIRTIRRQGKE